MNLSFTFLPLRSPFKRQTAHELALEHLQEAQNEVLMAEAEQESYLAQSNQAKARADMLRTRVRRLQSHINQAIGEA